MPVWVDPDYATKATTATITAATPALTKLTTQGGPRTGTADAGPSTAIKLFVAASAAGTSEVIDRGSYRGPAGIVITNVGGGAPTVNVDIQGSIDNVNFYNAAYALVATPNTVAVAQIAVTGTATTTYLLPTDQAWRYLRVVTSTVNNEVYSVTYYQ